MGFLFESFLIEIVAILTALVLGTITYIQLWSYSYWKRRNLPHLKPIFPYGTMENPLNRQEPIGCWLKNNYNKLKSQGHKHAGLYNFAAPVYMPIDPEYVKNIMQKDFHHFVDRGVFCNEKDDPLGAHLFALGGERWRKLRTKLTPTFTSGKMKMMFETLVKCSDSMKKAMDAYCQNRETIDIKETVARFTTDVIGSTAFGLECNSFESPNAEFRTYGKKVFQFTKLQFIKMLLFISNPQLGKLFKLTLIPKDTANFFLQVIKDTVHYREDNKVIRKDMLQLLIDIKNSKDGQTLTITEIASQAILFFAAGFETSSTTMTFCLYELACNQNIQQKVRDEIKNVLAKHNGEITYEAMMDMKYMGQVIDETLRKYPPVAFITRKCVKDYKVPKTNVEIEKGTMVFIPVLGLQHDPDHYSNPDKFDPKRFLDENKRNRHPFSYIPFGEGPRICIGLRFGVMQTKVGLTVLLKHYKFLLNNKTKLPLTMDPANRVLAAKGTIWLSAEKLD